MENFLLQVSKPGQPRPQYFMSTGVTLYADVRHFLEQGYLVLIDSLDSVCRDGVPVSEFGHEEA